MHHEACLLCLNWVCGGWSSRLHRQSIEKVMYFDFIFKLSSLWSDNVWAWCIWVETYWKLYNSKYDVPWGWADFKRRELENCKSPTTRPKSTFHWIFYFLLASLLLRFCILQHVCKQFDKNVYRIWKKKSAFQSSVAVLCCWYFDEILCLSASCSLASSSEFSRTFFNIRKYFSM